MTVRCSILSEGVSLSEREGLCVRGECYDITDGLSFSGILSPPTHLTNSLL